MKKLILRLLVSGVAIAGIAVAVILIFFQKNPLELSYNALVEVMKVDGEQSKMENYLTNDEDFRKLCEDGNYKIIMKGEFDLIKNAYTKIPLIETEKDYSSVLEATNNYIEALESTNHKIEVFKNYKAKLIADYKAAHGGTAPTSESQYSNAAYEGFKQEVMVLVGEQINSASLLNDKLLACLEESYYGSIYNYDLAMDVLVNAYCKYSLANINDAAVIARLEKIVAANVPAVKEVVAQNTDAYGATDFVDAVSKVNVYALITSDEYKATLDAESKAYATIIEDYIAVICG